MRWVEDSFYAQWRVQSGAVQRLRDEQDSPPERLLQAIWQHQRLLRERLQTVEGVPVRVLHPGFLNLEGGPDFRSAVVQVGEGPARSGDVEVDLRSGGWHAHGHDRNPAFRNVLLHVIWESGAPAAGAPPLVLLRQVLDAPLGELSLWLGGETAHSFPQELRGNCCGPLRRLSSGQLQELLKQAAGVRLRSKAAQFQARARQSGWEQSLWEGLFRALGYKHNVWPMQRLAELRPQWSEELVHGAGGPPIEPLALQARLLGLSGLLPSELTPSQLRADGYLRRVWDQWWRERDVLGDCILPREAWRLHGLRPANHPQRRLALAASWALAGDMPKRLERWCAAELPGRALPGSLLEHLQVGPDEFWSWHWTLRSPRLKRPQPMLGATRVADLAVNVVLPWLWARAEEGESKRMRSRLEERYFGWPAAQDNAVLRLARQRLLGGAGAKALPTAAAQQGLLQVTRDFCDHSNSLCAACKLPEVVRRFCEASA
jgi:Protein of unknown function (DUF2851)